MIYLQSCLYKGPGYTSLSNIYTGQKDQNGDYAEKCHIFFKFGVSIHQLKNSLDHKENM